MKMLFPCNSFQLPIHGKQAVILALGNSKVKLLEGMFSCSFSEIRYCTVATAVLGRTASATVNPAINSAVPRHANVATRLSTFRPTVLNSASELQPGRESNIHFSIQKGLQLHPPLLKPGSCRATPRNNASSVQYFLLFIIICVSKILMENV